MRSLKLTILFLLGSTIALAQGPDDYVQPMGYKQYSFPYNVNIGVGLPARKTHAAAYLEIGPSTGATKGALMPRLSTTERNAIPSPPAGLLIYNKTTNTYQYYNGIAWIEFGTGTGGSTDLTGVRDTTAALYDTAALKLTSIYRKKGTDSVFSCKNGICVFAYKDSVGSVITTDNQLKLTGSDVTFNKTVQTLTDGATVTWNIASGPNAKLTIGGNRTLDVTNEQNGDYGTLIVVQDGTGSRTLAVPNGTVTLNPAAGDTTVLVFFYDGTRFIWRDEDTTSLSGYVLRTELQDTAAAIRADIGGTTSIAIDVTPITGGLADNNVIYESVSSKVSQTSNLKVDPTIGTFKATNGFASINSYLQLSKTGGGEATVLGNSVRGTTSNVLTKMTNTDGLAYLQRYDYGHFWTKALAGTTGTTFTDTSANIAMQLNTTGELKINKAFENDDAGDYKLQIRGNSWFEGNKYVSGTVGIGILSPNSSAKVDITSTSGGLLIPRMNTTQQNAITGPATGLLIFNTDSALFRFYNGSAWTTIAAGTGGGGGGSGTVNSGTANRLAYYASTGTAVSETNANISIDNTNSRLLVNTTTANNASLSLDKGSNTYPLWITTASGAPVVLSQGTNTAELNPYTWTITPTGAGVFTLTSTQDIDIKTSGATKEINIKPNNVTSYTASQNTGEANNQFSGSVKFATTTSTANATLTAASNHIQYVDATSGNITITLPAASANTVGLVFKVIRIDASVNTVTISRAGSDTINGTTSKTVSTQYECVTVTGATSTTWIANTNAAL